MMRPFCLTNYIVKLQGKKREMMLSLITLSRDELELNRNPSHFRKTCRLYTAQELHQKASPLHSPGTVGVHGN